MRIHYNILVVKQNLLSASSLVCDLTSVPSESVRVDMQVNCPLWKIATAIMLHSVRFTSAISLQVLYCIALYRQFLEWPKYKLQGLLEKQDN